MAKFHTKRKPLTDLEIATTLTDVAVAYVSHWAKTEAKRLASRELVILPAKWGFQVGKFAVKEGNHVCSVHDSFDKNVGYFSNKKSAILYSVLLTKGRYIEAEALRVHDSLLHKLTEDRRHYQHQRKCSIARNDAFSAGVLDARLSDTDCRIEQAQRELDGILVRSRYSIGDIFAGQDLVSCKNQKRA